MLEVHCSGTPYEIGHQHGTVAKDRVVGSIAFYKDLFQESCSMNWEAVRQEAQQYIQPLQKLSPRYVEELQGLADGAGFELVDIVALNVRTEITFGLYTRVPSAPIQTDGCTSAAYRQPNGEVLLAQNWDWQPEQAPNLFICHISQPGTDIPDISMVTEGGVIGKIGINSSGVGTCLNAIRARGVDNTKIPIHLALRTALESHSAREAADKLYEMGTAGSGHILVSDPSEAIGLECTSIGMKEINFDGNGTLIHTNHLLLDHPGVDEPGWIPDSTDRIKRIAQLLDERLATSTIDHSSFFDFFRDEQGYPTAINRDQFSPGNASSLKSVAMNIAYNSALRQSKSLRAELSNLNNKPQASPSEIGNVSASIASFTKTLDEYQSLARQEIVPKKQEEGFERVKRFREDLSDFRTQVDSLKKVRDDAQHQANRTELLGRRPYNATPENPYANATTTNTHSAFQPRHPPQASALTTGSPDEMREAHAFREQNFFANTNQALDDYIARGQAVLGDLGQQREMLKSTQKRLYNVANTLGVSGDTIRMVERRAKEDKWIFFAGVVIFFLFCWLVLHFLR
ncbi:acyl-coenzyme A:6-aminopenicillanic acid acyl-transferase-domain-containing protein [Fusarium oxysporum Fo47]|nr:acyl-coenzyme A:6-aminopenicillanic acid acyl-transferase-domain-containing protein [Fusarium oxysporum Fo47]QKD54854.2 acyl-coenzyme A:6-aminopenicillanic acid acyl-transferase-domain-containing protein [Fusarium oxysporum Fo47]